ncbi:MAG TPA: 2-phospho-L-lactate guanylyltransferase [Rhizomicrobium sp.]|jgi:2-phospho-L-lactate guanylyltransferase|nr:2-phospho-L-lactate guanylyltransferase [Rhizomicrobium sp.]
MDQRVILPVKPFGEAKQRLASAMTASARANLAKEMFRHVLATAGAFAAPATIIVISRGSEVLDLARTYGATPLMEQMSSELNGALRQAAEFARARGASRLFIVAGDLPLLCEADLEALAAHECAIAPDRHGTGTNALAWPSSLGFCFGEKSFERHCKIATAGGYEAQFITRPGLAHDIDLPSDLIYARKVG